MVTCHHPLVDAGTMEHGAHAGRQGRALDGARQELVRLQILSGHVHDPFDTVAEAAGRPVRLIGAGTLSERVRASPPSFNALTFEGEVMGVEVVVAG